MQNDKIAQIYEMHYLDLDNAEVEYFPGKDIIKVSGDWINLKISNADFKETKEMVGMPVEQELTATITDTGLDKQTEIELLLSSYGLVRLRYTNGIDKVIGTDKFPVHLSYEKSGSPSVIILSMKHSSPELSKVLKSF